MGGSSATALPVARVIGLPVGCLLLATVSLETLVDSPVVMGKYLRTIDLTPGVNSPGHTLNLVADSCGGAGDLKPEDTRRSFRAFGDGDRGALWGAALWAVIISCSR